MWFQALWRSCCFADTFPSIRNVLCEPLPLPTELWNQFLESRAGVNSDGSRESVLPRRSNNVEVVPENHRLTFLGREDEIPRTGGSCEAFMTTSQPSPRARPDTILIVEDHPLVAKFYRLALERAGGFSCLVSENVAEILAAVEGGGVNLIILDISLKGAEWEGRPIDGVELARIVKDRTQGKLPILLATAHAMAGDRERLLAASGADGYLEKPVYDSKQLVDMVRQLLGQM